MDLKGKIAVVAGASGGVGREVSLELGRRGVDVVLVARRKDVLTTIKEEIERLGGSSSLYECDLTNLTSVDELVGDLEKNFEHVDILVNAVGVGVYKKLKDTSFEDWKRSLDVNVTAPFLLTQKLLPFLQKVEKAVVISMGSGMGRVAVAGRSPYCASKFALRGLMLSLAKEFKKSNIKICLLTLGSVLTSFGPLSLEKKMEKQKSGKKYLDPEDLAHTIVSKIENDSLEDEVVIYPSQYFSENKKGKS